MYGKDSGGKDLKNKIIDEFRERENGYMRLIGIDPGGWLLLVMVSLRKWQGENIVALIPVVSVQKRG